MERQLRLRFWVQLALGALFALALAATLIEPAWVEVIFRVEPDMGSGALELAIVAVSGLAAAASLALAGLEWRRAHSAAA